MHRYFPYIKKISFSIWLGILTCTSVYSQTCDVYVAMSTTMVSGGNCGPGYITLDSKLIYYDGDISSGEFRWYDSETATEPIQTYPCNDQGATCRYIYYAADAQQRYRWVSIFNYTTGCESERKLFIA